MPEKPLTVAAYAAGASLAAATLIYVFAPTFFLDSEVNSGSNSFLTGSSRKKGVVGLVNPANDCFINSILQALAGLGDLRVYLIREMHRRNIDEDWVYAEAVPEDWKGDGVKRISPVKKDLVAGQQKGLVTLGLKEMLDQLNKRPLYKKTISAAPFVEVLERAFKQNISRQQHDAQEFLQVVVERLCDEYHAGHRARKYARVKASRGSMQGKTASTNGDDMHEDPTASQGQHAQDNSTATAQPASAAGIPQDEDEEGFPMEGKTESQVECMSCGFKPRPLESRFCTLTLSVPTNMTSTTLNACFDGLFKTEYIDDYACDRCRLVHAHEVYSNELSKATSEESKARLEAALAKLQHSIQMDPEKPPKDVELPDSKHAPRRRIARHTRVTRFPKVLAIHLQRSIYAGQALKNSAKVAFPEKLPLGGLLLRRNYKLLGVVAHKGGHDTGHYESFRRQNVYPPFSNPSTFQPSGVYSKTATPMSTPQLQALTTVGEDGTPISVTPNLSSPASTSTPSFDSTIPSTANRKGFNPINGNGGASSNPGPTSAPRETTGKERKDSDTTSLRSIAASAKSTISKISPTRRSGSGSGGSREATPVPNGSATKSSHKKRKTQERWWRISDEKIKEASTRELLSMQREVYLLFYEMERDGP